jgi:hypothetical protein
MYVLESLVYLVARIPIIFEVFADSIFDVVIVALLK